jgi:hypothetical protein
MLLLLAACADCPPLDEIRVRGGTEAQAAAAEEELARLEDTLALPVCIDHVRIGGWTSTAHREGVYSRLTHVVGVHRDSEPERVREVVRHEVCHGVDLQNDLVDPDADWPSIYEEQLYDGYEPEELDAREIFAMSCEPGPDALAALWHQDCPGDADLYVTRMVTDRVFGLEDPEPGAVYEPIGSVVLTPAQRADLPRDDTYAGFAVNPDFTLSIALSGTDVGRLQLTVDPFTGLPRDPPVQASVDLAQPDPETTAAPYGWTSEEEGGRLPSGHELVVARLFVQSGYATRTHVRSDEPGSDGAWLPVDGPCVDAHADFFRFGEELWVGHYDGLSVEWGRFERR